MDMSDSSLYLINGIVFALLFFLVRIAGGYYCSYQFASKPLPEKCLGFLADTALTQ